MPSTEKETEPTILDKSLSSLDEAVTSAAKTAVFLSFQLEKNIVCKWSINYEYSCQSLEDGSANSATSYFYNLAFT